MLTGVPNIMVKREYEIKKSQETDTQMIPEQKDRYHVIHYAYLLYHRSMNEENRTMIQ